MIVSYLAPLQRGYQRMVEILFHPFDLATWLVIGFGCWLARLTSGGFPGGFNAPTSSWRTRGGDGDQLAELPAQVARGLEEVTSHLGWLLVLGGCVLLVVLVIVVVLMWLSARGRFIFLDNVLHRRAAITEPWKQLRRQGNSLFLWQLGFIVVAILAMLLTAAPGLLLLISAGEDWGARLVAGLVVMIVPMVLLAFALAYVNLFLIDFVVPLMYRHRLTTTAAWRRFLVLFRREPVDFLLYGLFVLGLYLLVVVALLIVVLATCCVAGLILILPYLGTVALLPLHLTYRAFSLEFLAQFGPEVDPFSGLADPAAAAPGAAPQPPEPPAEPAEGESGREE